MDCLDGFVGQTKSGTDFLRVVPALLGGHEKHLWVDDHRMTTWVYVRTACDDPSSAMNLNLDCTDLCQKIRDNGRLTRAGHSEQDAALRYELRTGVFKDLERIKW
jgi:hypothetical protein